MPAQPTVDAWMSTCQHARLAEILLLQKAILGALPGVTERIKWNAPSFCIDGDDRVTLRLQPGDRVELVFHRGVAKRADASTLQFADLTGWISWAAPDRGVVVLRDSAETTARLAGVTELVARWMLATRG